MNINRTIIVPASLVQISRTVAAGLSKGGVGMFETPLYTGTNITHYVSSGHIGSNWDAALNDANSLYAASQAVNPPINITLAQCQDLKAQSIVVDCDLENAHATIARLGMHL